MSRLKHLIILIGLSFFWATTATAQSGSAYLEASGPVSGKDMGPHFEYYLDTEWDETIDDILGQRASEFEPITTPVPNFGYTDDKIWLRLRVQNTTRDTDEWRIYVRENFLQYYDVYVVREDGNIDHVESHDPQTHFTARSTDYPELVTPIKMQPGEKVTLIISYWSGGSSHAAFSLETATSFAETAMRRMSKYYISYGMMAILVAVGALALVILRRGVFLAYLSYVVITLLYLMHADGVAFQYFWPGWPKFNSYFSIIIGTAFVMATYNFARVFLKTKFYHPKTDKVLIALFFLTPILTVPGAFIDPQLTKLSIIVMVFVAISMGTWAGCIAALKRFRQVRFFLFAWLCGVVSATLMNMRHVFGFDIAQDTVFDSIRVFMVVDAVMMGLGVADSYIQSMRRRQKEVQQSLLDAETNLKLNNRLYDLEEQYKLAVELAASRDEEMKNTVHDLRTPLHALRLNVQKFRDNGEVVAGDGALIDDTFTYLESLIAGQLQDTVVTSELMTAASPPSTEPEDGELSLPKTLQSIYEMFLPDAQEKGLDLRFVPTTQNADIDPLVLMRIVINLVSNAIKYTPSGKVLLGVRRTHDSLRVEVHDTGTGMSTSEFETALGRTVRLDKSGKDIDGHGYGLAIAHDLVKKHDLELYALDSRQNGSSIILEIPT